MTAEMRAAMGEAAVRAAEAVGYVGAGTVEFIADVSDRLRADRFYFMEMNTRLQVEHPVTEAITGQDLVEWQLRVAAGGRLPLAQRELAIDGWAMEARLYAEDAVKGFLPATGRLGFLSLPEARARIDSGVRAGDEITPYYDPMIAKVIVHGPDRETARRRLLSALGDSHAVGVTTNIAFLAALADHPEFREGEVDTGLIDRDLAMLTAAPEAPIEALALAALESLGLLSKDRASAGDPWTTLEGWRLWSGADHVASLQTEEEAIEVDVAILAPGRYRIGARGEAVVIEGVRVDADGVQFRTSDRHLRAKVINADESITVLMDGDSFTWTLPDPLARDAASETGGDRLTAPMPGLIKAVAAGPGDAVAKDAPVLVMEAMKMEHGLKAPRDGVVGEVFVEVGDQVEEGALLLALVEQEGA